MTSAARSPIRIVFGNSKAVITPAANAEVNAINFSPLRNITVTSVNDFYINII